MTISLAETRTIADSVETEWVMSLSLQFPTWGCRRLSDHLRAQGRPIAPHVVREILQRLGMHGRQERLALLEQYHAEDATGLSAAQVRHLEKANPCFRERNTVSSAPGEALVQDTFLLCRDRRFENIYLHCVIDTFCSYAVACLAPTRKPDDAIALLRDQVLPFYAARSIAVGSIETDSAREFCGWEAHPYGAFLAQHGVRHRAPRARSIRDGRNGYVERFTRTVIVEFLGADIGLLCDRLGALQARFGLWLSHYNARRPNPGYRNYGECPLAMIDRVSPRPMTTPGVAVDIAVAARELVGIRG